MTGGATRHFGRVVRERDAIADVDTGSVSPAEWQRVRQLKRIALVCLVVSVFAGACIWAVFGGAIMDSLAAAQGFRAAAHPNSYPHQSQ